MPKIVTAQAIFNPVQNALIYWCSDSNGNFWIRSAAGNWSQLDLMPASITDLDADFQSTQSANKIVSPASIITDNNDPKIVIVPVEQVGTEVVSPDSNPEPDAAPPTNATTTQIQ